MKRFAIVGFGCAGYNAACSIRNILTDSRIDVFDAVETAPANPMLTTYYAGNRINRDQVFPFGPMKTIQSSLNLNIHSGAAVKTVRCDTRQVELSSGECREYDSILVSTGARPLVPRAFEHNRDSFFLMRTLEDAEKLKARLEAGNIRSAAVIGASMVGIKVAELIYERGIKTTIVDAAPYIFPLSAYEDTAGMIERKLGTMGLDMIMNAHVGSIDKNGVTFGDGGYLEADLVCLCTGTRANIELVANLDVAEGQPLKINKGIVVDTTMKTSCEGIYAAGDCCEGINLQTGETSIIGLWANAEAQGRCAGRNMAGLKTNYYGNILHNITHFFGMDFIGLGDPQLPGEAVSYSEGNTFVKAVINGEQLQSINILGNAQISGILKSYLLKNLSGEYSGLSEIQKGLLRINGLDPAFLNRLEANG
ncbi:MAG: FAD-dependent oxidoreductase [Clostridiales bacterium]|nr:FAD-dependent oxidoreductase [Clostridiales bacterium]